MEELLRAFGIAAANLALDVAVGTPKGCACSMLSRPPEAARVEEQPVGAAARRGGVRATL